jgi:hypothetical protein
MRPATHRCRLKGLRATPQLPENTLKSIYLAPLTCAALLLACANAYSDGVEIGDANRITPMHRDFDTVDTHHRGYVTSQDVKDDDWISRNFVKCNVKQDGHTRREE